MNEKRKINAMALNCHMCAEGKGSCSIKLFLCIFHFISVVSLVEKIKSHFQVSRSLNNIPIFVYDFPRSFFLSVEYF